MGYWTSLWRNTSGCLKRIDQQTLNIKVQEILVADQSLLTKIRSFVKQLAMAMNDSSTLHPSLRPPVQVKGMIVLTKSNFSKTVQVPCIKMPRKEINKSRKNWRPLLLKLRGVKPIAALCDNDPLKQSHSLVLLDPSKLDNSDADTGHLEKLERLGFSSDAVETFDLDVGYDNWSVSDVMKAVLPQGAENVSSFTQIGHIAHLNLKEENLPYKNLIGEVILDKISSVKTVVNKLNSIDNTYRNFEMELLAGEDNFVTQTKEHNCIFELDFSKVYWNSRLSTEHQRIVENIPKGSVVYDVFAGVGPFTVPLAKKKDCTILANDLNPYSFESLEKNIRLNKLKTQNVKAHNMDGRDFIRDIVKPDLVTRIKDLHQSKIKDTYEQTIQGADNEVHPLSSENKKPYPSVFAVMNLPALAVDFLDAFVSLLSDLPVEFHQAQIIDKVLPTVFCYTFCAKGEDMEGEVKKRAEDILHQGLPSDAVVRNVRNVSPNKEMMCLSFKLWSGLVLTPKSEMHNKDQECEEPESKKLKHS